MKRPTQWCDSCESTVYTDDVHSCYDAKRGREEQDARDRVVEASAALEFAFRDPSDPWGYSVDAKQDELIEAVRALRAVRGEP